MNKTSLQTNDQPKANHLSASRILQRKCDCGNHSATGGKCSECGKKEHILQRKLTIGTSNDPLEQEADRVANEVLSRPSNPAITNTLPSIQRFDGQSSHQIDEAPPSVDAVLANPGTPLEPALRQDMEQRFGYDFSKILVHSDTAAEQSTHAVNAHAYTVGHNVVFGANQFKPETEKGRRLIAHELTHVIQQNNGSQSSLQRSVDTLAPSTEGEHAVAEVNEELTSESLAPSSTRPTVPADSDCPNYESGESSTSHGEPGHLDPDVERLAPDKLLIADFGVDWRHLKRSTGRDPTLQAWLTAWESDDSYQLSIIGFSDCVGTEGLNTRLRQARAANVEALLGPGAKSRTTFRGMAALGDYITDNNTPANRARNRGVIIEFHQEFEFPREEIIVTPQYCGPDSTQWLVDQMNRNRDNPVIRTMREIEWPRWIPIFNLGWTAAAFEDFADLVEPGGPWDFKSNQKQWRFKSGNTCPSAQCDKTVRLCGKCFSYDVPGNIHYGYIGQMASIRAWVLHEAAAFVQTGGGGRDPAHDTAAIDIGIAMADQGATLCGEIATHESELNRDGTEGCGSCPTAT